MHSWLHDTLSQLAGLAPLELAAAIACYVLSVVARGIAWSNVVALTPGSKASRPGIAGAFFAGGGVNAVAPARAGVGVRLLLARTYVRGLGWGALTGTLGVEALFNAIVAAGLMTWGGLRIAESGAELVPPGRQLAVGVAVVVLAAALLLPATRLLGTRARAVLADVKRGLRVVGRPRAYLTRVLPWQVVDWSARLATLALVLRASGLEHGAGTVLLAQAALCVAVLLPLTPAGLGTKQGALVLALAGVAPSTSLVAFGIALGLVHALVDVGLALGALALMVRTDAGRSVVRGLAGRLALARAR